MLTQPTSLVTRVFKARYFKDCDVLQASMPVKASYVWRSIMGSRDLIREGMMWRVGDGSRIRIFHDRWIQGLTGDSLSERGGIGSENLTISSLINLDSTWDKELIDAIFLPFERDAIFNTPIAETNSNDSLRWRFEPKGNFTVKSAYLLAVGYYSEHPHTSATNNKFWSKLVWARSIPPKVRIFAWRAFDNVIPTEYNLMRHHIPTQGLCSMCRNQIATTEHSLLWCSKVRYIWKKSSCWEIMKRGLFLDLVEIAAMLQKELSNENYEVWLVIMWLVWSFVCKSLHGNEEQVSEVSEEDGRWFWKVYQEARSSLTHFGVLGVQLGSKVWSRPRRGRIRVDVDAMFDPNRGRYGVGVIARDHNSTLLLAMAKRISPSSSSVMAELMAVIQGIIICMEKDLRPIEIFSGFYSCGSTFGFTGRLPGVTTGGFGGHFRES